MDLFWSILGETYRKNTNNNMSSVATVVSGAFASTLAVLVRKLPCFPSSGGESLRHSASVCWLMKWASSARRWQACGACGGSFLCARYCSAKSLTCKPFHRGASYCWAAEPVIFTLHPCIFPANSNVHKNYRSSNCVIAPLIHWYSLAFISHWLIDSLTHWFNSYILHWRAILHAW